VPPLARSRIEGFSTFCTRQGGQPQGACLRSTSWPIHPAGRLVQRCLEPAADIAGPAQRIITRPWSTFWCSDAIPHIRVAL